MNEPKLPCFLWNEVIPTSAYFYSGILQKTIAMETPIRRMFGKDAKLAHLSYRISGLSPRRRPQRQDVRTCLERGSRWLRQMKPSYRIYKPKWQKIIKTRNVRVIEAPTGIAKIEAGAYQAGTRQEPEDRESNHAERHLQEKNNEPVFTGMWLPEEENLNSNETDTTTTMTEQTPRITRSEVGQDITDKQLFVGMDRNTSAS